VYTVTPASRTSRERVDVLLGVDGGGLRSVEGGLPLRVRFVLTDRLAGVEQLVGDAVGLGLLGEIVEPRLLLVVRCHDEDAEFLAGNVVLLAVRLHPGGALGGEPRLLRVRRVVEPRVEHAGSSGRSGGTRGGVLSPRRRRRGRCAR